MKKIKAYLIFFGAILLLMSIPKFFFQKTQGHALSFFDLFWHFSEKNYKSSESLQKIEIENIQLKNRLKVLQEELLQKQQIIANIKHLKKELKEGDGKNLAMLKNKLLFQMKAIPAKVIYRSPSSWNSSLWLDVGEENNSSKEEPLIALDSPVVFGDAIVGVVDFVGKRQSRVKLITDSGLTPAVRSARGNVEKKHLMDNLNYLLDSFSKTELMGKNRKKEVITYLNTLKKEIEKKPIGSSFLAKGEIQGLSKPLWKSGNVTLKGIGFNYDFPDEMGPARDLRNGEIVNESLYKDPKALIKVNDILITTGMDGVFPPNFTVGQVTKIYPLKEGDYYYELEAKPTFGNFDEIDLVFVLPPLKL